MTSTTEYRTLKPNEEETTIRLWMDVMGKSEAEARLAFNHFSEEPRRFERTFVAVAPDGSLLSAAQYWLRQIRDANGKPQRVGHVLGMAAREDARRQGHATRLLDLLTGAMQTEGCAWSILFSRPEAAPLYTRSGWRAFASHWQQGPVTPNRERTARHRTKHIDASNLPDYLDDLCNIYAAFNAARPLSVVRDREYWHGYASWMLNDWLTHHDTQLIVAESDGAAVGYALYNIYPPHFVMSELCILPDHDDTPSALLDVVAYAEPNIVGGRVLMSSDPITDPALRALFGDGLQRGVDHTGLMAKPLTMSVDALEHTFAQPSAHYWSLDGY